MTKVNQQIDILNHLLQVESDQELLVQQAVENAQNKVLQAKASANELFQSQITQIQNQLEKEYETNLKQIKEAHKKTIEQFTQSLNQKSQNNENLNKCLEVLLFNT